MPFSQSVLEATSVAGSERKTTGSRSWGVALEDTRPAVLVLDDSADAHYSFDTSALIDGMERFYPISNFPDLWNRFDDLIKVGPDPRI